MFFIYMFLQQIHCNMRFDMGKIGFKTVFHWETLVQNVTPLESNLIIM